MELIKTVSILCSVLVLINHLLLICLGEPLFSLNFKAFRVNCYCRCCIYCVKSWLLFHMYVAWYNVEQCVSVYVCM